MSDGGPVVGSSSLPPENGPIADRHFEKLCKQGLDPGRAAAALVTQMAEWPRDPATWEPVQPKRKV